MYLLKRAAVVVGGIFVGANLLNYFVLGHAGDYLPGGERMGEWNAAKTRNRAINAALIRDASSGRLIKAEFGWSMPTAMKSMLDQHKGTSDNCPKA
jgi:hypothetical protein